MVSSQDTWMISCFQEGMMIHCGRKSVVLARAFTQRGVLVETHADKPYRLSREKYVEELKYINLRAQRRKENSAETDQWEQSQLRTLFGGLSWYAQQTAPHLSS